MTVMTFQVPQAVRRVCRAPRPPRAAPAVAAPGAPQPTRVTPGPWPAALPPPLLTLPLSSQYQQTLTHTGVGIHQWLINRTSWLMSYVHNNSMQADLVNNSTFGEVCDYIITVHLYTYCKRNAFAGVISFIITTIDMICCDCCHGCSNSFGLQPIQDTPPPTMTSTPNPSTIDALMASFVANASLVYTQEGKTAGTHFPQSLVLLSWTLCRINLKKPCPIFSSSEQIYPI